MSLKPYAKRLARPAYLRARPHLARAARPFTSRLYNRIRDMFEGRLNSLDAQVGAIRSEVDGIQRYVPVLLNAIASQNAIAREAKRSEADRTSRLAQSETQMANRLAEITKAVMERLEFVRKEVLFEVHYGGHQTRELATEARVLNPEKLEEAGRSIRLNLGCGHLALPGYLNVDSREVDGVDILSDVRQLPFEPGHVQEIFSAHLLEHFPVEDLVRSILPYWVSLLAPGGRFAAVVPDAEAMISEYSAGRYSFDDLRLVTFGEQEYKGDFHFNMFTPASLSELLATAGLVDIKVGETGRRNGACFEMEIEARRFQDVDLPG